MSGVYVLDGALMRREGRPPHPLIGYDDGFVYGVTMPRSTTIGDSITNVGCYDGVKYPYVGPATIDGSTDPANPLQITSMAIDKLMTVRSGYVHFFNCTFSGSQAKSDTALLDTRPAAVSRVIVERCDFDPGQAGASPWLNAIIGHHTTALRNRARRVIDFFGSYNTHGPITANVLYGNLMEWHAYFYAEEEGIVHPSDVRVHNDGIQHQGGGPGDGYDYGIDVVGNRLRGFQYEPDGVTIAPDQPGVPYAELASQGFQCQQNVQTGTPVNPRFSNNWIEGYQHTVVIRTRESWKGGGTPYNAVVEGNTWLDDRRRYYGTAADYYGVPGGRPYTVRVDNAVTVNGIAFPTDGAERPLGENNRYFIGTSVTAPSRRGELVTIRRDNFAGASENP